MTDREQEPTPWWRRIFRNRREEGARLAIDLLAAKFAMEAEGYERKCKTTRAEFYDSMARAIRNHRDWVLVRVSKS